MKKCECGHECHRNKDCPVCANDVCFICKCPNCLDVPKSVARHEHG